MQSCNVRRSGCGGGRGGLTYRRLGHRGSGLRRSSDSTGRFRNRSGAPFVATRAVLRGRGAAVGEAASEPGGCRSRGGSLARGGGRRSRSSSVATRRGGCARRGRVDLQCARERVGEAAVPAVVLGRERHTYSL